MKSDAFVQLDQHNGVVLPNRRVPIVFVPGIMGSRLADPATGKLIWNPMGPTNWEAGELQPKSEKRTKRLHNMVQPLEPAGHHDFFRGRSATPSRVIKQAERAGILHSYEVVWPPYRDLMLKLDAQDTRQTFRKLGWELDLNCCGYDWRRSIAEAAGLLAARVAEVRERCDGEKAVIIAHSLGGLVARYFLTQGGDKQVRLLFLCGSPSLGAPKVWMYMKDGVPLSPFTKGFDPAMAGASLLLVKWNVRDFMRRCASMWELLPKRMYTRHFKKWLEFDPKDTGLATESMYNPFGPPQTGKVLSDASDPDDVYVDPVLGFGDTKEDRAFLMDRSMRRASIDNSMFLFDKDKREPVLLRCHERTVFYCSKAHNTLSKFRVKLDEVVWHLSGNEFRTSLPRKASKKGDGSVPTQSASPPSNRVSPKGASKAYPRRYRPVATDHGSICGDVDVMKDIVKVLGDHLANA